jgi:hypothetical protein
MKKTLVVIILVLISSHQIFCFSEYIANITVFGSSTAELRSKLSEMKYSGYLLTDPSRDSFGVFCFKVLNYQEASDRIKFAVRISKELGCPVLYTFSDSQTLDILSFVVDSKVVFSWNTDPKLVGNSAKNREIIGVKFFSDFCKKQQNQLEVILESGKVHDKDFANDKLLEIFYFLGLPQYIAWTNYENARIDRGYLNVYDVLIDEVQNNELTGLINDSNVRIRKNPSLDGEVIGKLVKETAVKILGKTELQSRIQDQTSYWYQLELLDGTIGWVFGVYIDIERSGT